MNTYSSMQQNRIELLQKQIEEAEKQVSELKKRNRNKQQKMERYSNIFNKSYLAFWEIDISSVVGLKGKALPENASSLFRIVDVNDYSVDLFGAESREELIGSSLFPGKEQILSCILNEIPSFKGSVTIKSLKGEPLNLLLTAVLPGKNQDHLLLCMKDIGIRTRMEENLSLLIRNEEEQKRRSEIIQNNLLVLTSSLEKEALLTAILGEVKKLIPYTCANFLLLENGYLKTAALVGYEKYGVADYMKNSSVRLEDLGAAAKYIHNGEIIIIPDTHKSETWTSLPQTGFVRGYIGVPVKGLNGYDGLLCLDSDKPDVFSQSDSSMLRLFSYAASAALQSSQLYEHTTSELLKRQETERHLQESLEEKNILLKEIHHRVKNNLALIMSLINLQSGMLDDQRNKILFDELKQRIFTISLVHRRMYRSSDLRGVDLMSYISDLVETVKTYSSFKAGTRFDIGVTGAIHLEMDVLVPLALLLNELILNSVKYAFPESPGVICIRVHEEGGVCFLVFSDNGIGYPEPLNPAPDQLGLSLAETLASQIGGEITFRNDGGAVAELTFTLNPS